MQPFIIQFENLLNIIMESSCVLCCDPLKFVCVGKCNHKNMCEKCTLRMRILIKDFHCPLCKVRVFHILGRSLVNRDHRRPESRLRDFDGRSEHADDGLEH